MSFVTMCKKSGQRELISLGCCDILLPSLLVCGPKVNSSDCLGATYINDLLVLDVSVGYLDLWMAV